MNKNLKSPRHICPIPERIIWEDGECILDANIICGVDKSLDIQEGIASQRIYEEDLYWA